MQTKTLLFIVFILLIYSEKSFCQFTELPIYKDINQPVEERVKDLLSRMTLEEKIEPLFPFGFGLSYTIFEFNNLKFR
ncbi:MAG: hypothetical protein DRI95_12030 [Bacteroidetes bacterium]|nr:MAG: hypothetical protein DRI95_12030 [Bacteroidota bacterium]